MSAVSELEVREWLEEQGAGAEEPGGGELPLFLPRRTSWHLQERRRGRDGEASFVYSLCLVRLLSFPLLFPWCASHFRRIGLGGGQRGASNVPPLRGQRTGIGLYIVPP